MHVSCSSTGGSWFQKTAGEDRRGREGRLLETEGRGRLAGTVEEDKTQGRDTPNKKKKKKKTTKHGTAQHNTMQQGPGKAKQTRLSERGKHSTQQVEREDASKARGNTNKPRTHTTELTKRSAA